MFKRIETWFANLERRLRKSIGHDITIPEKRRLAWWHFQLFDHAFLRVPWTNFDKVAEGVYRSNQPGPARVLKYKEMGIRSILNLRGEDGRSPWLFEKEACEELGIELRTAKIYARKPAKRKEIVHLIDTMREMEKPFVMHCKSGADRAGLAAVLYKAIIEGAPLDEARKHLSLKYVHTDWTDTGIVDHIIDMYEERNTRDPIDMETWFRTEYDHKEAAASFADMRAGGRKR
ncbi:tyrosine-protein phosphatase [Tropicimonas aquimaris]|uniref:Tyrosine-protein phosphatase n=1 Tax=Tropicimonas aquimaris TaxID=914152 RepID=A0ABW3IT47_9RHOB